jgi:AraC family transcriptional regulator of adaptative response / DNA-3-methyladenine glycosylase II
VFDASPTAMRTRRTGRTAERAAGALVVRLPFRRPLRPDNLFGHLAATAVPGVEEVVGTTYRRTLRLSHGPGVVALTPASTHITCRVDLADVADLTTAIARCRRLLDLDADPEAVDRALGDDPVLAPLVAGAPGRRVPRTVDGAEFAVRAVLGQQVSTAAARTTTAALVASHGEPIDDPAGGLTHLFPTPECLVDADAALPATRRRTLAAVVDALASGRLDVGPGADRARCRAALGALPGVGPWTVEMVALRALGDPDAFPATDLGVRRAAGALRLPTAPAALRDHSRAWRPWRAYAVQHLWAVGDHPVNQWPPRPGRSVHPDRDLSERRAAAAQKEATRA